MERRAELPIKNSSADKRLIPSVAPEVVVWAIDAFPTADDAHLRTATAIASLYSNAEIYPVYVLSEETFSDRSSSPFLRPALKPMATKTILNLLADVTYLNLKKPRVLMEPSASRHACARRLTRFAKKIGACAIAVGSHGKSGLSKFFLGSFSEALLESSQLSVLMAGPHVGSDRGHRAPPRTVVFPTDFSPICTAAFEKIVKLARSFGAELHIFHKTLQPLDPLVQSSVHMLGGGWLTVDAFLAQDPVDHTQEANAWIERARNLGVKTRFIAENFREPVSEAIVQYVSRMAYGSSVVAMVSQTGLFAGALLGSVTRDVIRSSPLPVYVIPRET